MDKILSARIDEMVLNKIALLAHKLRVSKKKVIEGAVQMYAQKMESTEDMGVFEQTSGAWKRNESIDQTVNQGKSSFRKSIGRHQK